MREFVQRDRSEIRILAIDGGGVRGVMPAYWLCELEKSLANEWASHTVLQCFDWFAGTSTGSIIAAALAFGIPPKSILTFNRNECQKIFPTFAGSRFYKPWRWSGVIAPKHSDAGINSVLQAAFGTRRLGDLTKSDATKRLIIVSYNAASRRTTLFDSNDPQFSDVLIWQACRASAAAPTYLPEFELDINQNSNGQRPEPFLDGGVAANNPGAIALSKALGLRLSNSSVLLVSMGTGITGNGYSALRPSWDKWGGVAAWISDISGTIMSASSDAHEKIADEILLTSPNFRNYFRFDAPLNVATPQLDDATPKNMGDLETDARAYWSKSSTQSLVTALVSRLDCKRLPDLTSLAGRWHSVFSDDSDENSGRTEQTITIEVKNQAFIAGRTNSEDPSPGEFEASLVGDAIVGQWYNPDKNRASMFVFVRKSDDVLFGRWIGGVRNGTDMYWGQWTMTRIKDE